jgi:hypothetical protein
MRTIKGIRLGRPFRSLMTTMTTTTTTSSSRASAD